MEIEVLAKDHIRIKDELDSTFDLYVLDDGGIQIISPENKPLEIEDRQLTFQPGSIIIREK